MSMTSRPSGRYWSSATATIFSPAIATPPLNIPSALTTFAFLMTVSAGFAMSIPL
jgi:hypothetical protein